MKIHAGLDAGTGAMVTASATAAHVHDVTLASKPVRGDGTVAYGVSGYPGIKKRTETVGLNCGRGAPC